MGTVWRVWDVRDRTYRAAKMLQQSDSASLLRFVRETGTRIDHPHVVAPTGWSAEDDRVLFAMPLIGGGSVATLIADYGPLPATLVRTLTLQLLDALVAVHAAGIVHRDVKPANLLLEPSGRGEPHLLAFRLRYRGAARRAAADQDIRHGAHAGIFGAGG